MSWFDSDWKRRAAITVNNHSGANTIDIEVAVPSTYAQFWDEIQADGDDVRVCLADGVTLASYKIDSFNYSNKVVNVHVNDVTVNSADAAVVLWLYWNNASAAAAVSTFTIASEKTGSLELGIPGTGSHPVIPCRAELPAATVPRHQIGKQAAEDLHLWFDLSGVLNKRGTLYEDSQLLEEIDFFTFITSTSGSAVNSMIDTAEHRLVHPHYIRVTSKAGSSGTNYVGKLTVSTTEGRTINCLVGIIVQDATEPA